MSIKVTADIICPGLASSPFRKGITLQDYLKSSCDFFKQESLENFQQTQDLYNQCGLNKPEKNPCLITFAINEIDQDNYDDSLHKDEPILDANTKLNITLANSQILYASDRKTSSIDCKDERHCNLEFSNQKSFRIKNSSNSPKKLSHLSPFKKQMFRSMYGNQFKYSIIQPSEHSIFASTIHNKFGLVSKIADRRSISKKQEHFKEKNERNFNEVIKFEKMTKSKYTSKLQLLEIRIDGIKDRLYERKTLLR